MRIFPLLLCAALALAGCTNASNTPAPATASARQIEYIAALAAKALKNRRRSSIAKGYKPLIRRAEESLGGTSASSKPAVTFVTALLSPRLTTVGCDCGRGQESKLHQ